MGDRASGKVGPGTKSALDVIATGKKGSFCEQNHCSSALSTVLVMGVVVLVVVVAVVVVIVVVQSSYGKSDIRKAESVRVAEVQEQEMQAYAPSSIGLPYCFYFWSWR
jgi:hypothetical protein